MLLSSISLDKLIVFLRDRFNDPFWYFFFLLPNPRYTLSSRFVCIARNSAQSSRSNFKDAKARLIRKIASVGEFRGILERRKRREERIVILTFLRERSKGKRTYNYPQFHRRTSDAGRKQGKERRHSSKSFSANFQTSPSLSILSDYRLYQFFTRSTRNEITRITFARCSLTRRVVAS